MTNGSGDLWAEVVNGGVEDRVEVNQRMLIDKMLARYSSDFVVLRELIQNSDDAQSTSFTLQLFCDPPNAQVKYQDIDEEKNKQSGYFLENLSQLIKTHLSSPITEKTSLDTQFDNCLIREMRTRNNGKTFSDEDWKRVITIAEGNTNADAIGQFGVGFFSVFSYSEKPMILSGKHCLAFAWQNGKSLTTFRKELPVDQQSPSTSIVLQMKNPFLLQSPSPSSTNGTTAKRGKANGTRPSKSKKNILTNEIIATLDFNELKSYFVKVLSFTKYLNELIIEINACRVFEVHKSREELPSTKLSLAAQRLNSFNDHHHLFQLHSFLQTEQRFSIVHGPSITLNHIDVQAHVKIEQEFHRQIQGVLKKKLPSSIHIQFLFPSNQMFDEQQWKALTGSDAQKNMLSKLIPLKFVEKRIEPDGQIFIGLATHQSTGIGMHLYSHLIPTIERENLDLQDPYISIWNEQLLITIGRILRFIYDQTIRDLVNQLDQQSNDRFHSLLSPYAFHPSSPNKEIGRILVDGFFSSDDDLLVPVRRCPSDVHLSLIPSNEAYLSCSAHVEKFLAIPLVPFELGQHQFFVVLQQRQWINEINDELISAHLRDCVLLRDELVELLRWLCQHYIGEIFTKIRYRSSTQSPIIELNQLQYFDALNYANIPLPANVLPSEIVGHFSRDDLQRRLRLSPLTIKQLIEFYLQDKQRALFASANTASTILHLICHHAKKFSAKEFDEILQILSQLPCVPTSEGMRFAHQSYIPSEHLSAQLPIITLYIPQLARPSADQNTDYPVALDFLKSIGCRTIHIDTSTKSSDPAARLSSPTDESFENGKFIDEIVAQRKNLSGNDLRALRTSPCLLGRTLDATATITRRKVLPSELHFPHIEHELHWPNLIFLDWSGDLPRHSPQYTLLKELAVKEVPDLTKLLSRIEQEHQHRHTLTPDDYSLPLALNFFITHFHNHYSTIWKNSPPRNAFLPSLDPLKKSPDDLLLLPVDRVFRDAGPLCPSLHPHVREHFSEHFDVGLIGVKVRPTVSMAFNVLLEHRNVLVKVDTAGKYFAYLNQLDGLNKSVIENIAKRAFIPLAASASTNYMKVTEVFLRSNSSLDDEVTRGLIDYVDFGAEGNSFLRSVGVVSYPSAENLVQLLIERQSKYFAANSPSNTAQLIKSKLDFYTNCLKQLAVVCHVARELHSEPLKSRLRNQPWCLAFQTINRANASSERIFRIVRPNQIYLDDDHQSVIDVQPLCAPDEPELTKLYELFGAKWISESVQRTLTHRGRTFASQRGEQLKAVIQSRLDMLFVNNRGEQWDNANEQRIEMLRKRFSVFECQTIVCQLKFENEMRTLNSSQCSSCALEWKNNEVTLFIDENLPTLDYIDISAELTRFVFQKAVHSLIHSISDKLSSPIETLKRRGIPVDRLLKLQQQQQAPIQPLLEVQSPPVEQTRPGHASTTGPPTVSEPLARGLIQSFRDWMSPALPSASPSNATRKSSAENLSSTVDALRVKDFEKNRGNEEEELRRMMETTRPYASNEFRQEEHSRFETNNSCEFVPSTNLRRHAQTFHGISLYLDEGIAPTDQLMQQCHLFSFLLSSLAKQVFHIGIPSLHLFHDVDSARIAFNTHGSIFYNVRYFTQVFWKDLHPLLLRRELTSSNVLVRRWMNFYYMVTCHELAHNIDSNHDLNFINRLERVSAAFMDRRDAFVSTFAFP